MKFSISGFFKASPCLPAAINRGHPFWKFRFWSLAFFLDWHGNSVFDPSCRLVPETRPLVAIKIQIWCGLVVFCLLLALQTSFFKNASLFWLLLFSTSRVSQRPWRDHDTKQRRHSNSSFLQLLGGTFWSSYSRPRPLVTKSNLRLPALLFPSFWRIKNEQ